MIPGYAGDLIYSYEGILQIFAPKEDPNGLTNKFIDCQFGKNLSVLFPYGQCIFPLYALKYK